VDMKPTIIIFHAFAFGCFACVEGI